MNRSQASLGKPFINPAADFLFIGSLWSIAATFVLLAKPALFGALQVQLLAALVLAVNSAHFAASTVRLYSEREHFAKYPFVTMGLPLLTIAALTLCTLFPVDLGPHLQALYLTWSPYHYAAQTYGLAVMYCFRSGLPLSSEEKRWVWWACMLPFFRAFLGAPTSGLGWFVSRAALASYPGVLTLLQLASELLLLATFVVPVVLAVRLYGLKRRTLPLISLTMMFANGLWWTALDYLNAFVLATVAHGVQYLAIAMVYHANARAREPAIRRSRVDHASAFYAKCLLLGYALFYCWPYAFVWAGAGLAQSILLVTAIINIHHFIVDRYIWRVASKPAIEARQTEQATATAQPAV